MSKASSVKQRSFGKFAFAALLVLTFCMVHPAATAHAKKRKPAKHGTIRIQSTPAGLPIEINGKQEGLTSSTGYVDFQHLKPGLYSVVITLPNGKRWTREVNLVAGRIKCVDVTYRIHCWDYPLTASIAKTSRDGDAIVAYKSSVTYDGPETLKYRWTVSPSSARIVSGGTGSPDIAINTAGVNEEVRVSLLVDADDGSGDPRCKSEAVAEIIVTKPCIPVTAVRVSTESSYRPGDKVTFTAHPELPATTRYKWTVTPEPAGTITITGDGTASITVDTTGVTEDTRITASVVVDDDDGSNDPDCPPVSAEASVTCGFDCGPVRNLNDLKKRLDNFVSELQRTPGSEGWVYIYGPRKKADVVSNQARTYLVTERGVDASRVKVRAVEGSDNVHFEFYVVPLGEQPTPPDMRQLRELDPLPGIQHVPGSPRRAPARRRGRRR